MKNIGQKIRALRQAREWSQEEIAGKLHISVPAYSKIETSITDINLSRLEQIAGVFGLSAAELLTYGEAQLKADEEKLSAIDSQVIQLQMEVIKLYEQLRKLNKDK